jgi:predicted membrane chloride channel (bestrophin family)
MILNLLKALLIWLVITTIIFAILTGIHSCRHFTNDHSDLNIMKINAADFEKQLRKAAEEGDQPVNKHVEQMSHPLLREKAEELRRLYNRRQEIVRIIQKRRDALSEKGQISEQTLTILNKELELIVQENEKIKQHYMKIVAYAETEAVDRMQDANKQELEAAQLLRDHDDILNSINDPKSFR